MLPDINKTAKYKDKNRFILSLKTQNEFGLRDDEVPDQYKPILPPGTVHVDLIEQNIRMARRIKEITKVNYLSKIQAKIES
jgi:hypothetical protein